MFLTIREGEIFVDGRLVEPSSLLVVLTPRTLARLIAKAIPDRKAATQFLLEKMVGGFWKGARNESR